MKEKVYDVIIVGGSYAGLSAAMTLGRSRRAVLVVDGGKPCNRQTPHAHNLITQDGEEPAGIARKARAQVAAYPTVDFLSGMVEGLSGRDGAFHLRTEDGRTYEAKKVILATGVKDIPMPVEGFAACWGITVLHCPYCHGYEVADKPLGVIANGDTAFEMGRLIHHWSHNLTLFTNGPATLREEHRHGLQARGIGIVEKEITAIEHLDGRLRRLRFRDGSAHPLEAVFARGGIAQQDVIATTGCNLLSEGMMTGLIQVDDFGKTTVPGIYAVGDTCSPMRSLSMAMSSGMKAGAVINNELIAAVF